MSLTNVLPEGTKVTVSTTLPGSSKKHLLSPSSSGGENPPWSSTAPSSLQLSFPTPVAATHVAFTFQGGFVGTSVGVWVAEEKDAEKEGVIRLGLELGGKIYPEDRNKRQIFEIPFPPSGALPSELEIEGAAGDNPSGLPLLKELKFEFDKSSDQYGRITLYSVEILGSSSA
ncbi:hypothetical protein C343_03510 [Cryptococcus neoformans C23]|uniref:Uncharacterized protein n=2 Tax=Cryptococcus neoformans TaxID=5207 RepID=A0A854QDS4_CRYNE|nr:hypothetical protein CNAG_02422 [Cryptococcus neoformans var. grubii H99]AUB25213.1 hypothetical protein CKF44_02422 [Cryptococcus neoformans var. grubii]OWZ31482.1 hypothetical protein C347_03573 [Cryptococcus neoformans var. grubii AD2-60a]OWZ42612.1 hypothetical protein C353_03416 [Cryptococcus neoformans var. grubii AD1-83a]OWZ43643.1 hypothetical protein C343_03510 [Cryptococcus neoformans var. grubii C23]OWZ44691.1 hypothetical protein C356_03303 [Cryptococcus neoformans var. grubii c|eukprot:XP_012050141.1 hypothetical protein CNAG_02422 [Cryptococcus neoformans var. grubii H99]